MQNRHLHAIKVLLVAALCFIIVASCASTSNKSFYVDNYLSALELQQGKIVPDHAVERFSQVFADLKDEDLQQSIRDTYSEKLYFNDTFRTIDNLQELSRYLLDTAEKVVETKVTITDIAQSNQDYYARWVMDMEFTVYSKTINSRSIGITHLRFNEDGKIILHQDYWDSADAFYRHLPIVGYMVNRVRRSL